MPAAQLGRPGFACPSSLRLLALRSPPTVWLLKKNNLWHCCDRRSYRGIAAAPPIPAGVVSRYTPPRPPTAALFCLRPLFPVGLLSCACHPTPDSGLFCSLSCSSLELRSLQKVSWGGGGGGQVGLGKDLDTCEGLFQYAED